MTLALWNNVWLDSSIYHATAAAAVGMLISFIFGNLLVFQSRCKIYFQDSIPRTKGVQKNQQKKKKTVVFEIAQGKWYTIVDGM